MEQQQEILDKPATSKVAVYSPIEAGIKAMLEKHGSVLTNPPVVTGNATALAAVKASRKELVTFRNTLEKTRVAEKSASLEYGRLVDAEAKRIQAFATPLELAYDKIVTAEEQRLEDIRQAELEAERQRIAGHRARIQTIKDVRETANMCRSAERIKQLIDGMPALFAGTFEEFQDEALTAFNEVCTVLQQLHDAKVEAEAQAAELQRQRDELAAQQAEANRKAAIQARLQAIRDLRTAGAMAKTAAEVQTVLDGAKVLAPDASYQEFEPEAQNLYDSVCGDLADLQSSKYEDEARAAEQQSKRDEMNRREQELQARERETADREAAQQREQDALRREQEAQASKPMVSRVMAAVIGERPAFAAPAAEPAPPARRFASSHEIDRPDDEDIVIGLAQHFDATEAEVVAWLRDMDLDAVLASLQQTEAA